MDTIQEILKNSNHHLSLFRDEEIAESLQEKIFSKETTGKDIFFELEKLKLKKLKLQFLLNLHYYYNKKVSGGIFS